MKTTMKLLTLCAMVAIVLATSCKKETIVVQDNAISAKFYIDSPDTVYVSDGDTILGVTLYDVSTGGVPKSGGDYYIKYLKSIDAYYSGQDGMVEGYLNYKSKPMIYNTFSNGTIYNGQDRGFYGTPVLIVVKTLIQTVSITLAYGSSGDISYYKIILDARGFLKDNYYKIVGKHSYGTIDYSKYILYQGSL